MTDERERWERIKKRDVGVFDLFYKETAPALCSYLHQLTGQIQSAEDIAQQVFTDLWERPNGFQPERGSLRAYVFGIGRKRALDWWRRRPQIGAEPKESTARDEDRTPLIQDALVRLSEEHRTLLWLREAEGYSYAELAYILDLPLGTVKSRLFTAREELRKIWTEESGRGTR